MLTSPVLSCSGCSGAHASSWRACGAGAGAGRLAALWRARPRARCAHHILSPNSFNVRLCKYNTSPWLNNVAVAKAGFSQNFLRIVCEL